MKICSGLTFSRLVSVHSVVAASVWAGDPADRHNTRIPRLTSHPAQSPCPSEPSFTSRVRTGNVLFFFLGGRGGETVQLTKETTLDLRGLTTELKNHLLYINTGGRS